MQQRESKLEPQLEHAMLVAIQNPTEGTERALERARTQKVGMHSPPVSNGRQGPEIRELARGRGVVG